MSMKLVTDYVIPCVLCEDPLEHVTIYRDDALGQEISQRERLPHRCAEMRALLSERNR